MRRSKSVVFGSICGLCCMACVGLYLAQVNQQAALAHEEALARFGGDQVEVVVAQRDIAAGETIGDSSVEMKLWVASLLPEGALTNRSEVVGSQAGTSILKGEVISNRRLGAVSSSIEVPDGLTAVSVPARDVQAVGGALGVGSRTDVYAIGPNATSVLAEDALVIATSASDKGAASGSGSSSWVTLAVRPSQVEELITAAQNLELYFALPDGGSSSEEKGAVQ